MTTLPVRSGAVAVGGDLLDVRLSLRTATTVIGDVGDYLGGVCRHGE